MIQHKQMTDTVLGVRGQCSVGKNNQRVPMGATAVALRAIVRLRNSLAELGEEGNICSDIPLQLCARLYRWSP